jgi:hypothetical protein
MKFIDRIKERYQAWKEKQFLKKHGCDNWRQYNRRYDPDVFYPASKVEHFYHGYRYFTPIEYHDHVVYKWDLGYDGSAVVDDWCKENLAGKYRFDFLRVFQQTPIGLNGVEKTEWHINEIGGSDYIFFACQKPEDFFLFQLKWGT